MERRALIASAVQDQSFSSQISRLIILGNSVVPIVLEEEDDIKAVSQRSPTCGPTDQLSRTLSGVVTQFRNVSTQAKQNTTQPHYSTCLPFSLKFHALCRLTYYLEQVTRQEQVYRSNLYLGRCLERSLRRRAKKPLYARQIRRGSELGTASKSRYPWSA